MCKIQVQFAMEKGISSDKASMLFFYFGLISTFARISSGVLLDFKLIDCPILSITAVFINGVAVLCLALTRNFSEILTIFLVLGLTDGGFACTANLLILNSVKPSQFAFAYGLWLCVISFSMALGPVTSGLYSFLKWVNISRCIQLIQKRLSSELLHWAILLCCMPRRQSTLDVTNLYIVTCQDRKAWWSTLLPWLIHEYRCLIVGTCNAI